MCSIQDGRVVNRPLEIDRVYVDGLLRCICRLHPCKRVTRPINPLDAVPAVNEVWHCGFLRSIGGADQHSRGVIPDVRIFYRVVRENGMENDEYKHIIG